MQFYKDGFRGGNPDIRQAAPNRRNRGVDEPLPEKVDVLIGPTLTAPGDDAVAYRADLELQWTPVEAAAGYWVEVASDADPTAADDLGREAGARRVPIVARLDADIPIGHGEMTRLTIRPERLHFFDLETGDSLHAGDAALGSQAEDHRKAMPA